MADHEGTVIDMAEPTPDRLEEIAASRSHDPDIRWLIDEVMRLRRELRLALEAIRRLGEALH